MKKFLTSTLVLISAASLLAEQKPAVDLSTASKAIDALIEKNYAAKEIKPNSPASDSVFLRRIYLDVIGRIPTADEARQFLHSMAPDKRSKLITSLLESKAHVSQEFNHWADILRITSRMPGQDATNGQMYATWVKQAIEKNMPYDQFVSALVTADGMIDENGAAGFYLRDSGMPLDHLATTVQTFLGTQMVCAQCHDHPFDEWTQMDYYKLAAFSSPVGVVRTPESITKTIQMVNDAAREQGRKVDQLRGKKKKLEKEKNKNPEVAAEIAQTNGEMMAVSQILEKKKNNVRKVQKGLQNLTQNFRNSVIGETNKPLKLPHDYAYDDGKPNEIITAATPFGENIEVKEGESRVQAYASWMTSPENPLFTKVIANRMWKRAMGVGLIEPVDNIREDTAASNPELLAYLEKLMIDLKYDLTAYISIIYNSKAYQRESSSFDMFAGETFHYSGPRMHRMSAEQVWDSIVTLIRTDVDEMIETQYTGTTGRGDAWKKIESLSSDDLMKAQQKLATFTTDADQKVETFREQSDKAIESKDEKAAKRLGEEIARFNASATKEYAELTFWDPSKMNGYVRTPFRNVPRLLLQKLERAFPGIDFPKENRYATYGNKKGDKREDKKSDDGDLKARLSKDEFYAYKRSQQYQSRLKPFVRASELTSPAPDGHFLRTFGQSDRDLIENSNDAASVPQSLALMNDKIFYTLTDANSAISKEIAAAKNDDAAIDSIYLAMLSRKPSDKERSLLRTELETSGKDGVQGIIWTLLNTQQFIFVQ
jgi:hypothetical protein